jgi:hypothetical protein
MQPSICFEISTKIIAMPKPKPSHDEEPRGRVVQRAARAIAQVGAVDILHFARELELEHRGVLLPGRARAEGEQGEMARDMFREICLGTGG